MTATPITKKKEGTDTFVEPPEAHNDAADISSPVEIDSKPNKTAALVKGQLQAEAVFSLHAALQAEYLQTKAEPIQSQDQ